VNDKKEPFNAVGDPFFKQVGEEHAEEEGDGGRGDSALGAANNGPKGLQGAPLGDCFLA